MCRTTEMGRFADWQITLTPVQRLMGRLLTGSFQQIKTAKLTSGGSSSAVS